MEKKSTHTKIRLKHQKDLGLNVPDGYFEQNKNHLFEAIKAEEAKAKRFSIHPVLQYGIAASFTLLISFFVFNQNKQISSTAEEFIIENGNDLVNSILIEDQMIEQFADESILNDLEQQVQITDDEVLDLILNEPTDFDSLLII